MLLRKLDKIPQTIERRQSAIARMENRCAQARDTLTKTIDNINVIQPNAKIADEQAMTSARLEYEAQIILDYSAQKVEAARSLVDLLDQAEQEILGEIKLMESFLATKKTFDQNPLAEDYVEKLKSRIQNSTAANDGEHYCLCRGLNVGQMVQCDNPKCPFEWFHVECVGITNRSENSWLCPYCSQLLKNTTTDENRINPE
ncbi:PHD-finger family protein [Trichomonas vaginalis G3]|uniref:PHD-finger family protein n=1 Tax=Trichomonas vaginalis (strain ATCC PRA-98 / G3) TaxID=412133 RepID=A2DHE0_TRIV3|nr:methylated histone binding [Trichomonas vaginalis G3]EAY20213.1 PHD-finger family protein [Trichomonas vaginalis G3]KAI5507708.1 methylated histone binding [Trichomonas vaginalis G3]|eukprot:XP_001581199.1 PHD-finger family protein [Trichomonas vaginalis G3]